MNASFFAKTLLFPKKIPTNEEKIIFQKTITQSRVYKIMEPILCIFIPAIFYKFSLFPSRMGIKPYLSGLTDSINNLSVLVNHVQTQLFFIGCDQRKSGFTTTELSSIDCFHLTA